MRCRVSQNWASKGWGGMVIPRIGMEVVVEFLEGDPDKPLVTGCVYNGKNDVPYELPAQKTRSTFKTDTHQGKGFNELRFEDKAGEEEIYVHAEKDLHEAVENDRANFLGGSRYTVVDQQSHEVVQLSKSTMTGISETRNVGKSLFLKVGSGTGLAIAYSMAARKAQEQFGQMKALLMSRISQLRDGYYRDVDGDSIELTTGNSSEGVGGVKSISAGGALSLSSEDNVGITADRNMHMISEDNYVISAGNQIILRCGKGEIKMTRDGRIKITGTKIDLN